MIQLPAKEKGWEKGAPGAPVDGDRIVRSISRIRGLNVQSTGVLIFQVTLLFIRQNCRCILNRLWGKNSSAKHAAVFAKSFPKLLNNKFSVLLYS